MKRRLESGALVFCAVFAAALLVYGPLFFAAVFGDDPRLPHDVLRGVLSTRYFALTGEATYQPLVTLLNHLTRGEPVFSRLISILLHAVNALLLWALARRAGVASKTALAAAVAFAVFPTNTETLAFSSYKGHVLAFGAAEAAVLCWAAMLESAVPAPWLAGAAAALLFGLLCKESALVALPLCAAWSVCFARAKPRRRQWTGAAVLALVAWAYLVWRFGVLEPADFVRRPMPGPLAVLGWYFKTLLLPYPLCRERVWTSDTVWDVLGAAYFALLWAARRKPRALFASLWIGACCLPFLRLVPFAGDNAVADRFVYGASAGFALLASLALSQGRGPLVLYGLIALWAGEGARRDVLYTSARAFCEQTVACAPDHPRAHAALAREMIVSGEFEPGKTEALKALSLDPRSPGAYNLLGVSEFNLGDADGAQDALDHALVFDPGSAEARNNIANVLLARGFEDEALEDYEMAAQLRPDWDAPRQKAEELRAKIASEPKTRTPRRRRRPRHR